MTTGQFISRMYAIKEKDKRFDVYLDLLKLPVEKTIQIINSVDQQLADEELDKMITNCKKLLISKMVDL